MKIKDFTRMSTYPMYLKWTWFYYCSFFIWIYCMHWTISTEIRVSFVYYIMRPNFTTVYFRLMSKHKTSDMFVYSFHGNMFDISEFIRFVCVIVVNESTMNGKYARTIKFSLCVCFFFLSLLLLLLSSCRNFVFPIKAKTKMLYCVAISVLMWFDKWFPTTVQMQLFVSVCIRFISYIHVKRKIERGILYLCYIATS